MLYILRAIFGTLHPYGGTSCPAAGDGASPSLRDERTAGLILLAAAVAKLFLHDLVELNLMARSVAFITVGLLLLAGGIVYQRLWDEELPSPAATAS